MTARWASRLPLVVALAASMSALPAHAQYVQSRGRAYLSFAPDHHDSDRVVHPRESFDFYLVVELDVGASQEVVMAATEGRIVYAPSLFLTTAEWGETSLQFGSGMNAGYYDFMVGWGDIPPRLHNGPNVIAQFAGLFLEETESVLVGIEASSLCNTAWDDCPPLRWTERNVLDHIFRAEVGTQGGAIRVMASSVPTEASSWGAVKALYEGGQ